MFSLSRLFNKEKANTDTSGSSTNRFEDLAAPKTDIIETPKTKEQLSAERQQRKIIAAFAMGEENYPYVISQDDFDVSSDVRNSVMDKLAYDEITDKMKSDFLSKIAMPSMIKGEQAVFDSLYTKHENRILSMMVRDDFDDYQHNSLADLQKFLQTYPTPMAFESSANALLEKIRKYNDAEKYAEYVSSMEGFQKKVYGKRYEYFKQIKTLDQEADDKFEREGGHEWAAGDAGFAQISRTRSREEIASLGDINEGLADDSCEDMLFSDPDKQIYAVFDGAGGMGNGRLASTVAYNTLCDFNSKYEMKHSNSLALALDVASANVANTPDIGRGCTTGVVASVANRNGRMVLAYASVGDSRIYIIDKKGNARMVTRDEGFGRYITNSIGGKNKDGELGHCEQFGDIDLHPGDRIAIVSDGVTGDEEPDLLGEETIGKIVHHSRNARDAARKLIFNARKKDDRTAVVFSPNFDKLN